MEIITIIFAIDGVTLVIVIVVVVVVVVERVKNEERMRYLPCELDERI